MIRNLQFELLQGWPWWWALLLTAAVVGSVALFYHRAARRVSRNCLILLVSMRSVAMFAVLLCLFRPSLRFQRGRLTRPVVVVMADVSESMSIRDFAGQPGRFRRVKELLTEKDGTAATLEENFDTRWYAFSSHAKAVAQRKDYAAMTADGKATDIVTSVKDALGDVKASEIGGVVMLTDGIHTTVADPEKELPAFGAPFFMVGVGSILGTSEDYRDIAIARVEAKREVAVKTTLPIVAYVEATGFPDRVVPVVLKEDGVEIARDRLVLDNTPGTQKVTLHYTPQNKGDFELTIELPADPAERVAENNVSTVPIWVGDPRIRVLLVEGRPRQEFGTLNAVLQRDPQIEVLAFYRVAANRFNLQGRIKGIELTGFPQKYDELKQFKVLILGTLESEAFSKAQTEFIRKFVAEGGGFMMLGGDRSFGPGGYAGTPIEEVLPVLVGGMNIGQEREPFQLTLTGAGRMHPVFAGIADFFAVEKVRETGRVPDLLGCVRVLRAKPAAEVLAIHPRRRGEHGPLVAVAAGRFGSGRVLAATIDTTWIWYRPMKGLGRDSPYVRYWGQAMRWLAGAEETRRATGAHVAAYADRHYYEPGMRPHLNARVTDIEGQATERARVSAEVMARRGKGEAGTDGGVLKKTEFTPIEGRRGDFEVDLETLVPGKYEVVVRAELGGKTLGEAVIGLRVGEPTREFERLDLNEQSLRNVASASRGRYLPLLSFNRLPEIIRSRQEEQTEPVELALWNSGLLFFVFLLLVSAEWILRKRRLLS